MHEEYMELTTSDVADLRNAGTVRLGGAISAAKFLSVFADTIPWVHLDIAPTANTDRERGINGVMMTQVFGGDVSPYFVELLNVIYPKPPTASPR